MSKESNTLLNYKVIIFLQLFSCVFISWYLFGDNLQAKWNVVDDHEIFNLIGNSQHLPLNRIWSALETTEVVKFGNYPRYRPSYYIIRILECIVWGKNPFYWYIARLFMLSASLFLYWRVLQKYLGIIASGLLLVYFLHYTFWSDLFSRLGPAETYCTIGLALYIYGFSKLIASINEHQKAFGKLDIFLFTVGAIICAGTKENFLILTASSWILLIYLYTSGIKSKSLFISVIIQSIYSLIIVVSVYLSISKEGVDVYSNSISVTDRTAVLISLLKQAKIKYLILGSIVLGLIAATAKIFNKKDYFLIFFKGLLATSVLVSIYALQFIFYNGAWPNNTRYDFPGVLVIPLYISVVYWVAYKTIEIKNFLFKPQILFALTGYILIIFAIYSAGGYEGHKATAAANVHASKQFTKRVQRLQRLFTKNPSIPVIFVTSNPIDYEAIFSYQRFLQKGGAVNPISIETQYVSLESAESLFGKLQSELVALSKNGDANFAPLPLSVEKCFAIIFSGQNSSLACKIV